MEQIDVSFCVPVYNVSAFLTDCIDSIMAQTKDLSAEIICIDDCSSDDSWDVLQAISSRSSQLICLRNESNRGVSYCRNRAMDTARGKYVWFVDPDDLLYPGTVKRFFDSAERSQADVALGDYARVEESYALSQVPMEQTEEFSFEAAEWMPHPCDASGKSMCAIWAGLFRTQFLKRHQLRFRENIIAQEDTLFYYEVEQAYPVIIRTHAKCYLYRQRSSSVMHRKSEERMERYYAGMRIMLEVYLDYLHSEKYRDKDVLTEKIHRSYENVCSCLAQCTDHAFVRKNLKELKRLGYYPYPFRKAVLRQEGPKLKALFDFLLPIGVCFWFAHYAYAFANKRRFSDH